MGAAGGGARAARQGERLSEAARRPLLVALAHPDDETFGVGGAMARAVEEGHRVVIVCATRGEVGEIADPSLATPETLGPGRGREAGPPHRVARLYYVALPKSAIARFAEAAKSAGVQWGLADAMQDEAAV